MKVIIKEEKYLSIQQITLERVIRKKETVYEYTSRFKFNITTPASVKVPMPGLLLYRLYSVFYFYSFKFFAEGFV